MGTTSEYKVSAINVIGEGAKSIGMSLISAMEPYQPLMPTKKSAASSYIEIEWIPPQDGGSIIRGYYVYKNGVQVGDVDWNVYTFTVTSNLQAGNTY